MADSGWAISGWSGTDDDAATTATNQLIMPAAAHTAKVIYAYGDPIYLSPTGRVTVDGVRYEDEDILKYDPIGGWSLYIDGSAVGLAPTDVNGFYLEIGGTILMTLDKPSNKLPGLVGTMIDDSDIVRFTPTALGDLTDGTFELYLDGSDVDLATATEDLDAIAFDRAAT